MEGRELMKSVLKVGLLIWMELVIFGAFTFLPPVQGFRVPALASIMIFHVPNAMAATMASLLSAIWFAAIFWMMSSRWPQHRSRCCSGC
jgi:hypothetical protein